VTTTGKPSYGTLPSTFTITLASLATSSTLTVGRQSTLIDNTSGLLFDAQLILKVTTGTTPTANTVIQCWAIGGDGTLTAGGAGASDAALTPSPNAQILVPLLTINNRVTTSNLTYVSSPVSFAQAFGGFLPPRFGIWVTHNTGVNLNATGGNHAADYVPLQTQSV
jgi:hypothetical protein